jgi:riboflavin kinase/FMN adenylyltransferase
MVKASRESNLASVVLTFDPHPGALLGRRPVSTLSTIEERADLIAQTGADELVVLSFTPSVAGTTAADFVATLQQELGMRELWVGPDFALGHRREGGVEFLDALGQKTGFVVRIIEPLRWKGKVVSSTRIRSELTVGRVQEAADLLGRPYRLFGTVVSGQHLGRGLGIPTANLEPPPERLIPANGVYACKAHTQLIQDWSAVVNIGTRPTVADDRLTVEAHLLGFEGDLYGQELGLDFVARLRDEKAFGSLAELVDQIHNDIAQAEQVLAGHPRPE